MENFTNKISSLLLLSLLASSLSSCESSPKKTGLEVGNETKAVLDKKEKRIEIKGLSIPGLNSQARFSPDGSSLLFVSAERPEHKNAQIYLLNLKTKSEKRLTFQDGENASPAFDPDGTGFIYSSNTDELKEDPKFIREALARIKGEQPTKTPPTAQPAWMSQAYDIYHSNWEGTQIGRLTETKNYDSEGSLHPTYNLMVFSSLRSGKLDLYTTDRKGQNQKLLTRAPVNQAQPVYSPDGKKLVWVKYSEDLAEAQIVSGLVNARSPQNLTSAPALHQTPRWFSDGEWILFSSDRSVKGNFDLFVIKADGSCLHQLTYHSAQDIYPDVSPDGKWISFTSDRGGSPQLYVMSYRKPESCPEDGPAAKLKK